MPKNTGKPISPSKKHLARMQREQKQRRYILIGIISVLVIVLLIILYGFLKQTVLQAGQPVAVVDDTKITTRQWQAQTKFARSSLIRSAENTMQFLQFFGNDPSMQSQFVSQLQQIQTQLEPTTVGKQVLDEMINDTVVRKEAAKLGITVSEDEINKAFEEALGYFANGTPTPAPTTASVPTSTLSPLQMTLTAPTETPTPTATPEVTQTVTATLSLTATPTLTPTPSEVVSPTIQLTPTITPTPQPTATPFTYEAYQDIFKKTVEDYKTRFGVSEKDLRYVLESNLIRKKVEEVVLKDVSSLQPYVWARHILVDSEEKANEAILRYKKGESFCKLASELSSDPGSKDSCGDLSWFTKGNMIPEFETAAFNLNVGDISAPVKSQYGYHVILSLGKEDRKLSDSDYEQLRQTKFSEWLEKVKALYTIVTKDYWADRVPQEPVLSAEIVQFIQSALQSQQNP